MFSGGKGNRKDFHTRENLARVWQSSGLTFKHLRMYKADLRPHKEVLTQKQVPCLVFFFFFFFFFFLGGRGRGMEFLSSFVIYKTLEGLTKQVPC